MVCESRITKTQITNYDRLLVALKTAGVQIISSSSTSVRTSIGTFSRISATAAFGFSGDIEDMAPVGRAYAEAGVRAWASRRKWTVTESEAGQHIHLIQRRN